MCRLLGYIGPPILLESIISKPEHSLVVQSYKPLEMQEALLNADGFGIGWYHPHQETEPFTYKNIQPIWNDLNLNSLNRYVESGTILGYVRSATPGQAVDLSNCQPFCYENLLFIHNGYIDKFRQSLYRQIRDRLKDIAYQSINGSTDSEHIFALLINEITVEMNYDLKNVLKTTLGILTELATICEVKFLANTIVSDGNQLVASRFAQGTIPPSLYYLKNDPKFPESVIIASEPLFTAEWKKIPEQSIIKVTKNLDIEIYKP
ncbi:MAG: ergothioneine biosynthesis protein EgtC [Microcoleaceae cyanobacterium MO_207.B10]|nr:ergothioneine biosynthesis protein EgtC [Microcoleaceae cyanobacterium MO_207.B10]